MIIDTFTVAGLLAAAVMLVLVLLLWWCGNDGACV